MPTKQILHRGQEQAPGRSSAAGRRAKGPLRHICRLISFLDALYLVGDFLYRRSLRYSTATAAVCLLGYLGNFLPGVETYPVRVAIALPLLVGSTTLLSGLVLKNIPNLFFSRWMNVAQAADLDLMEDYRKSQQAEHLDALWERVYRFEWAIGSSLTRIHPHPVECPPHVVSDVHAPDDPLQRGRFQFHRRARFALQRHQPQPRQRYHLGIDLRFLEDWRNGAYFDRSDVKLMEQFDGSSTLSAVKREAGYGHLATLGHLPRRLTQKVWLALITRAINVQVGEAITCLDRKYETDYFNAQALFWPGEENEPWLLHQFPGARAELLKRRRLLLTRVFGRDRLDARRLLERMVLPCFLTAVDLRVRFDPEYLDGSLGHTAIADLQAAGLEARRIAPYRRLAEEAARDRRALFDVLQSIRPELLSPGRAESLRAVRIAMHINRQRLRRLVRRAAKASAAGKPLLARISEILDDVLCDRARYSRLLVGLRTHHELARLHHLTYVHLLEALYDSCLPSSPVPSPTSRPSRSVVG